MNNRLVITSENFTTKKLCWFVLSSTQLTHPHSWLCSAWTTWYQTCTMLVAKHSSQSEVFLSPQPSPSLASMSRLLVSTRGYPLSTIRKSQEATCFMPILLVKDWSFADTQTILSSVFVASLTDLWSSYEFEAAVVCPVFYCEYLSLIDIPSVFVFLVVVRVWGREVCPVFLFSLFAPLWSSEAYLVFVFVCVC